MCRVYRASTSSPGISMRRPVSRISEPSYSAPSFGVGTHLAVGYLWTSLRIRVRLTLPESPRPALPFLKLPHCYCLAWRAASSWANHTLGCLGVFLPTPMAWRQGEVDLSAHSSELRPRG